MAKAKSTTSKKTTAKKTTGKAKATKSTKPAAKKAAPKKAAAPAATRSRHDRDALMPQVVELRDGGLGWEAVASQLGIDPGLSRLLYMTAKVKPKDRIKGTDDEIAAGIIDARANNQAWGLIAARTRLPESKVRGIYRDATGQSDKEGYVAVSRRAAAKPAAAKKAPSNKAAKAEKTASAKSKKKAVTKSRKATKGSGNPSKG